MEKMESSVDKLVRPLPETFAPASQEIECPSQPCYQAYHQGVSSVLRRSEPAGASCQHCNRFL